MSFSTTMGKSQHLPRKASKLSLKRMSSGMEASFAKEIRRRLRRWLGKNH